jgi:hypothetical protein
VSCVRCTGDEIDEILCCVLYDGVYDFVPVRGNDIKTEKHVCNAPCDALPATINVLF